MTSDKRIQTAKIGYIIISALLCALGITLIAVSDFPVPLLCWIGGLLLEAFGLVKSIGYFSRDLYRLAFQYDLAFGILMIALGATLLARSERMMNVVFIFLGICILSDALLKIQIAIDSRRFGIPRWWLILAVAIATGVVGFLLVLRPSESAQFIMVLLGCSLLAEGVLNLVTILTAVRMIRRRRPYVIEAEYSELEG